MQGNHYERNGELEKTSTEGDMVRRLDLVAGSGQVVQDLGFCILQVLNNGTRLWNSTPAWKFHGQIALPTSLLDTV